MSKSKKVYVSPGDLLTVSDAGKKLGISKVFLKVLRDATGVTPTIVGNCKVFDATQLAKLHAELLRRIPGHDVNVPRRKGRPKSTELGTR